MAQYAFDRCISVAGTYVNSNAKKGITAGNLAFWAEQITEPSLSFTSETEDIVDARNNVVMVLQNGRGATFSASNAFFNTSILAAQTGSTVVTTSANDIVVKYEVVPYKDGSKTTYTPVAQGEEGKEFYAVVYELNDDGSFKNATASTAVTVTEAGVINDGTAGKKYLVVYNAAAPTANGEHVKVLADAENELLDITAEVLLRDLCDQNLYYAFLMMRGKLSGEAEWGMARDGSHAFEFTAMPEYCSAEKTLVDIIIVKDQDMAKPVSA